MASSKGGKSGSNVMDLQVAREKRASRQDSAADARFSQDHATPPSVYADTEQQQVEKDQKSTADKTKSGKGNRRFDREKVDRLKGEIARGEYRIDYFEVADKYIEHERFS